MPSPSTSPYDDATRQALSAVLDALLLDCLALALICQKAERHLSEGCEDVCELCCHLQKWAKRLGDASAALGGYPPGTAEEVAERHRIDDWPTTPMGPDADDQVRAELADRVSQLSGWVADGVKQASAAGAADVLVLLGKILGKLTKFGWRIGRGTTPAPGAAEAVQPPAENLTKTQPSGASKELAK